MSRRIEHVGDACRVLVYGPDVISSAVLLSGHQAEYHAPAVAAARRGGAGVAGAGAARAVDAAAGAAAGAVAGERGGGGVVHGRRVRRRLNRQAVMYLLDIAIG